MRSGMKPWREIKKGRAGWAEYDTVQIDNIRRFHPFVADEPNDLLYKMMKERKEQNVTFDICRESRRRQRKRREWS